MYQPANNDMCQPDNDNINMNENKPSHPVLKRGLKRTITNRKCMRTQMTK